MTSQSSKIPVNTIQEIANDVLAAKVVIVHLQRTAIDPGNEGTIINREVVAAVIVLSHPPPLLKTAEEEREAGQDLKSRQQW